MDKNNFYSVMQSHILKAREVKDTILKAEPSLSTIRLLNFNRFQIF